MLTEAVKRYTNRSLTTAEIIAELVALAKEMRGNQKHAAGRHSKNNPQPSTRETTRGFLFHGGGCGI